MTFLAAVDTSLRLGVFALALTLSSYETKPAARGFGNHCQDVFIDPF